MAKAKIGVLGIGEVGKAIAGIFSKDFTVLKKDLTYDELGKNKVEVLHICLPYNNDFEKIVAGQAKINLPALIIIHSTVKPGTTQGIFDKTKIPTVHSPIMGAHPNLAKDLLIFTKIIGPTDKRSARLAVNHLEEVGIKTVVFNNSLESEISKLFDTTYYAWNIIFSKVLWKICQDKNLDFGNVYTRLNEVYNEGYSKSKPNVIRPILKYYPGPIGGHCIIPNVELLEKTIPSAISKIIIEENKKFSR